MVKIIFKKPYFFFFVSIIIFLIIGFINRSETLDINIHDTYFIIRYYHLAIVLAILFSFIGLLYFTLIKTNFDLVKWMTITHTVVTIGGFFLMLTFFKLIRNEITLGDYESVMDNFYFNEKMNWGIFIAFFSIVVVQILFIVNIIYSLIKGRNRLFN